MTTTKASKATSMADLMASYGDSFKPLKKGDIVEGTVKKLTSKEILLDINGKSDALVLEYDKKNLENLLKLLKVGDKVKASVISPESEEGFPVVSLRRMLDDLIYDQLNKNNESRDQVMVNITEQGRGGYFAETESGTRGFLPNSQVMADTTDLVGKKIPVKIIELNKANRRVIFSQKALHYVTELSAMQKLAKEGETVTGVISSTSPYGIYVDLDRDGSKLEGFIHISEISHERVESIDDKFKAGDSITAYVLAVDGENRRINLSLKKLEQDMFEGVEAKYPKESKVKGTVTDVKSRGVTVELEKGINGFIPSTKVESADAYKVGQSVEAEVTDYDMKRRVVLLSPVLKAVPLSYR